MSISCLNCSAALDDDAKFCPECGSSVEVQCPNCKKVVRAESKFCTYCAFKLASLSVGRFSSQYAFDSSNVKTTGSLSENFSRMSDSEFLAFVRGDLSQRTKAELLLALKELHRRDSLDWFSRDMAEKRIQQTLSPESREPSGSSYDDSITGIARSLDKEKAMKLITYGAILTAICAVIFLWGHSYTSNFANYARAGLLNLAGQTDSAYRLASVGKFLGAVGFVGGVVLLIVGFAKR